MKVPAAVADEARLRYGGRLDEALARLEAALATARATPFDVPFQDRIQLGLRLADLYLAADQTERARFLLEAEVQYAEQIFQLIKPTGTPDQVRAAAAGRYQVRDRATQVALLGQAAPEIEVADWILGRPTTLAAQRGRVVLLEFWARWCRPCLTLFPVLRDLHSRYEEHGLGILALTRYCGPASADDPLAQRNRERDAVREIIADRGLAIRIGIAPDGRLQQRYGATGVPAFALIDRAGIIRFASSTPDNAELERAIVSLMTTATAGNS